MNKLLVILAMLAFGLTFTNDSQLHAQGYTAIYDARCPTTRFPYGDDNVNAIHNISRQYTGFTLTNNFIVPASRSGNTIAGFWVAWRNLGSHALERRNLTELGAGFVSLNKRGIGTLSGGVDLTLNPSQLGVGTKFFYVEQVTRDGELNRSIIKVNIY